MAAKGYMTDFEALRETLESAGTVKWNLHRGFNSVNNQRQNLIYRQENTEIGAEESFEDLRKRILWNSQGGGDFTIYTVPEKAANQGTYHWFRVESQTQPGVAGIGAFNPATMGYVTREDLERERRMWELERENEELQEAINGPSGFWQGILRDALQDGTVKETLSGLMQLGLRVAQAKMNGPIQLASQPIAQLQGFPKSAAVETPSEETDNYEYQDGAFDFLDRVRKVFGDDEARFYAFLIKLQRLFESNPQMWVGMIEQQNG